MYRIRDLYSYLPFIYRNKYIDEILKCCQIEIEKFFDDLINSEKEYQVSTATYSLAWWCDFVGIDYDNSLDIEITRSNILARMKSNGITTVDVIKKIVESYSNGTCEVIENYSDYSFTIKFIDIIGVPKRIDEIKKIIDKVKPAHLAYNFEFKFHTWDDIKNTGKTWEDWKKSGKTWNDLKGGIL
ncbi:putative phage tail protein [Peptostreptococcus canis]|uniref:DUF2313 domain-containing protein n=1 Tax=Peptostreptococcus canis TaxID=1159213 RepID=A0ABR6TN72_9FIRM|nr:putative phage tail protein [Peptostreptococcus canis]MBC2576588.1 DUF2313 domain-containing protein [Peptostreptococcus canis]MBP1998775.1 hypothetical protein [Peptostreptococcus canis]